MGKRINSGKKAGSYMRSRIKWLKNKIHGLKVDWRNEPQRSRSVTSDCFCMARQVLEIFINCIISDIEAPNVTHCFKSVCHRIDTTHAWFCLWGFFFYVTSSTATAGLRCIGHRADFPCARLQDGFFVCIRKCHRDICKCLESQPDKSQTKQW